MKDELTEIISNVCATQLALESLRANDAARALELLEVALDASVLALNRLANEADPAERERAVSVLRRIRAYRQLYPRRVGADLSAVANGLLARSGGLAEGRVRKILDEFE
jgi:hypothetical protein